jgi:uncharacterized coiled-coil protein SlyX
MAIWDKLRTELDRAGRAAQGALDEGKLRLEIFRSRQLVDRAAQSLGYAVFRDRVGREAIDEHTLERLTDAVREREQELALLEDRMRDLTGRSVPRDDVPPDVDHSAAAEGTSAAGAPADAAPPAAASGASTGAGAAPSSGATETPAPTSP